MRQKVLSLDIIDMSHMVVCFFVVHTFWLCFLANIQLSTSICGIQNSKFLQFVSKMSRGELIIDDNQVKESALPATGDWAAEYQQQYNRSPAWADQFVCDKSSINLVDAVNLHITSVMCMYLYTFAHVSLYCLYIHTCACTCT